MSKKKELESLDLEGKVGAVSRLINLASVSKSDAQNFYDLCAGLCRNRVFFMM